MNVHPAHLRSFMVFGAAVVMTAAACAAQAQPSTTRPPAKPVVTTAEQPMAFGVIDIGAVLRESTATQALQRQMQLEQDNYQNAFDKEQRELRLAEEDIERERGSLAAEVYADKRRAFQERLTKAGTDFRARRRQLEETFSAANTQVNKTLTAIIDELAVKNGLSVVLRREAVLYQKNAVDITAAAAALLNARMPSVAVVIPPVSP